jgi:hypothetical protein
MCKDNNETEQAQEFRGTNQRYTQFDEASPMKDVEERLYTRVGGKPFSRLRSILEHERRNLSTRLDSINRVLQLLTPEIEQTLEVEETLKKLGIK